MKKVVIATGTLGGGGAERVFLNIANEMAERDIKVNILVTGSRPTESYSLSNKITVEKISSMRKNKVLKVIDKLIQFRKYFKRHKDSICISFFPDVSAYCVLSSVGIGNKNIVSERNDPNIIPRKRYMKIIRNFAFEGADCCVFQTSDSKGYFSRRVQSKGKVISNPINVFQLPVAAPLEQRKKIVLAVGRIVPQKNFSMLIKAWQTIHKAFPSYQLHIYGDKTYWDGMFAKELQSYIDQNEMYECVKMMGFSEDIYSKMNEAAVYVSSSDFEGMSNTMLEAMALGTPTVATNCPIGGAKTIIQSEKNGILVPVGDVDEMANAILRLLSDIDLRKRLSNNSIVIRDELSIQNICDKWLELI